jgi:signal transduction histidine kinase
MSQLHPSQLVAAAVYFLPALVWGIVATDLWAFVVRVRPRNALSRLLPWLTTMAAAFYVGEAVFALLPDDLHLRPPPWLTALYVAHDTIIILTVAVTLHLAKVMAPGVRTPSRRWLVAHYGLAALVIAIIINPHLLPGATREAQLHTMRVIHFAYIIVILALSVAHAARFARRGLWRPGSLGDLRTADIVVLTAGVLGAAVLFIALLRPGMHSWTTPWWVSLLNGAVGLTLATPFAVRVLGLVVRETALMAVNLTVVAVVYWCATVLLARSGPQFVAQLQLAAVLTPVLLLVPAQPWLREAVGRALFRRRHRRQFELQEAVLRLSPELGIAECCRRAMHELVRILQLRGAGILRDDDGTAVAVGALNMEPLRRVWPRGAAADALPTAVFAGGVFRELPPELQEALIEAEIVGVTPIVSSRRRWGCGFVTTGVLRASFTLEEIESAQALAGQFALVLDAAELLERAVSVERSLAHSEKLAAVGEMAARVAHEIRNPVTAARSLAQLMVRDPASPHAAEHADLILAELERVERQVQALLRFARREEFSFAPVDLGEVARSALQPLRQRLEASGIALDVAIASGVTARADREKLRQVVMNLLDNAADAVGGVEDKRLALTVYRSDGTAVIEVGDSGPGVPADVLPRLFEPFFSLKTTGTGLGLAIVKRTVEAHGGRVEARTAAAGGLLLRVELPVAAAATASAA